MEAKEKPTFKFRLTVERSKSDKRWRPTLKLTTNKAGSLMNSIESKCLGKNIVIMSNGCSEYIESGLVWINARQQGMRTIEPRHHRGYPFKGAAIEEANDMKRAIVRTLRKAKKEYDAA